MTDTDTLTRVCIPHGIHVAADWVVLFEGEIAQRCTTERDARMEAQRGDRVRFQLDPNPCGDDETAGRFSLVTPTGTAMAEYTLCAKHIREHHADFEHDALDARARDTEHPTENVADPLYWADTDLNDSVACLFCGV